MLNGGASKKNISYFRIWLLSTILCLCAACSLSEPEETLKENNLNRNSINSIKLQNSTFTKISTPSANIRDETVSNYDRLEIFSSYQTKSRRKTINFPEDCQYGILKGTKNWESILACAAALDSIKTDLQKVAKDANCDASFDRLLEPDYAYNVKFYPFTNNKYLVEMRCWTAAYNLSNIYLLYDESKIPSTAQILEFPSFKFTYDEDSDVAKTLEKVTVKAVGGRSFNPQTKELIVFDKARGIGDAGKYARYSLATGTPKLEEFRAKFKWDGRSYQAEDVIKSSPKTWKKYYP